MNKNNRYSTRVTLFCVACYFILWWFFAYFIPENWKCFGIPSWFFWSCLVLPLLLVIASIVSALALTRKGA